MSCPTRPRVTPVIRFWCPTCRKTLKSPDHNACKKIPCPHCQQRLEIPSPPRNRTILAPLVEGPSPSPQASLVPDAVSHVDQTEVMEDHSAAEAVDPYPILEVLPAFP